MPVRLFLSSGDLMADRRFDFARDLQLKGDLAAAADLLLQAAELAPGFASAWFTLGEIRQRLGEREQAIAAFRKARDADPDDRHGAGLRLMLLGAEQLSAMPPAYVRALFDQYAPKFEAALVQDLGYRGPARCCSRPCCRCAPPRVNPPSSSAPSILAAAPGLWPAHSRRRSIISPESICRQA
jgi:tetratricopeptide (TPR) repeat protein